jgi:ubiquinone/menaquinone biosynthesis C-methylase UbiE
MFSGILPFMRCTRCLRSELRSGPEGLVCASCGANYPVRDGIPDMAGEDPAEVITPFQRLMQTRAVVSIYEKLWRQFGYFLASSRPFGREMQTVLRLRNGRDAERVLDLACGTGVFTRPLARRGGGLVVGLDLSWPMLRHARRLMVKEAVQNILYVRGTAFCLPFVDAAFPYINCCGALHLFDRPGAALDEIRRILGPGGFLCAQTTIRPERSAGIAYFLEQFIRFGFFREEELLKQLKIRDFHVLERERHRISFTFLARRAV